MSTRALVLALAPAPAPAPARFSRHSLSAGASLLPFCLIAMTVVPNATADCLPPRGIQVQQLGGDKALVVGSWPQQEIYRDTLSPEKLMDSLLHVLNSPPYAYRGHIEQVRPYRLRDASGNTTGLSREESRSRLHPSASHSVRRNGSHGFYFGQDVHRLDGRLLR